MGLEGIQQRRRETEIPAHELADLLRAVHTREVEHKVRLRTPRIQLLRRGIEVIFKDFRHGNAVVPRLPVPNVLQLCAQVLTYEPLRAGDQYLHGTDTTAI